MQFIVKERTGHYVSYKNKNFKIVQSKKNKLIGSTSEASLSCYAFITDYSRVPNNRVGWNKRVGWKLLPKIINV